MFGNYSSLSLRAFRNDRDEAAADEYPAIGTLGDKPVQIKIARSKCAFANSIPASNSSSLDTVELRILWIHIREQFASTDIGCNTKVFQYARWVVWMYHPYGMQRRLQHTPGGRRSTQAGLNFD